jgi:hypothetical protein
MMFLHRLANNNAVGNWRRVRYDGPEEKMLRVAAPCELEISQV